MYLWLNLKKSTFVDLMLNQVTSEIEMADALNVATEHQESFCF
jgi:hypothetical protein